MTQYTHDRMPLINKALYNKIDFERLDADIFSNTAHEAAKMVRGDKGNQKNKPTQLRRFYDELVMWNDSVQQAEMREEKYKEMEPFIKMLKAKVMYAMGRGHVDDNFKDFFSCCIDRINSAQTLKHGKLFMEAFMGYYKTLEPTR